MPKHSRGSEQTNSDRRNAKAPKKNPKKSDDGKTGRTVGGYTQSKLAIRLQKRSNVGE